MRGIAGGACVLLAALAVAPRPVRADVEETERRLKAVGVDPALRERIHAGVDRAVHFLLRAQVSDGHWADPAYQEWRDGVTALAALALRHASTPRAREGAAKAIAWLFDRPSEPRDMVVNDVYTGGIAAYLLAADRSHADDAALIGRALAHGQDRRTGWWGYGNRFPGYASRLGTQDVVQLSTTQFAVLGLWSAERLGAPNDSAVWMRHADGLCRTQSREGSWSYVPTSFRGYLNGTFIGCACLELTRAALRNVPDVPADLRKRILVAQLKARDALIRDGKTLLAGQQDSDGTPRVRDFYGLYALEKACVFAGIERLGEVPWYARGAEILLGAQGADGGWTPPKSTRWLGPKAGRGAQGVVDTSFALLFLLRTSETSRPTTPSPIDVPKAPATTPTTPGK
jgi:hypothetical protein